MPLPLAAHTEATRQAERLVRDPHLFKWYAVALLALVIYAYANEVERRRFDIVAAGLAVWLAGRFNEIGEAPVRQASGRPPPWGPPRPPAPPIPLGPHHRSSVLF